MTTKAELVAWLKTTNPYRVILVEIIGILDTNGTPINFYLSNRPYTSTSTDTPANNSYTAAISGGVTFSEEIDLSGSASISYGDIELDNTDNIRNGDSWLNYVWINKSVNIYLGDARWTRADFYNIFSGLVKDITVKDRNSVNLVLVNALEKLNKSISGTTIGGTGPNKDQLIPLTFGECFNVTPLLVDNTTLEYQVHPGPIEGFIEVRDNGVPLTGTSLPVFSPNTGKFRLSVQPAGTITASVQGSKNTLASTYQSKIGSIIANIITNYVP